MKLTQIFIALIVSPIFYFPIYFKINIRAWLRENFKNHCKVFPFAMIKCKFRDSRFIGWIQFLNFHDFEIAGIFMRVLRAIVLSGSSDNTIILQVLNTYDPLST